MNKPTCQYTKKPIDCKAWLSLTQAQPNSKRNAENCLTYKLRQARACDFMPLLTTNTSLHFFVFVLACLCVINDDQALRVYIFLFVFTRICSHFVQNYEQIKYGRTCGKTKANSNKNSFALICPRKPLKKRILQGL